MTQNILIRFKELSEKLTSGKFNNQHLKRGLKVDGKNIISGVLVILTGIFGLAVTLSVIQRETYKRSRAAISQNLPDVKLPVWDDYKVNFKEIENKYGAPYQDNTDIGNVGSSKMMQLFGGGMVIREFRNKGWDYYMAGHMGTFHSPPYESVENQLPYISPAPGAPNPASPNYGFNTGLGFINMDYDSKAVVWENSGLDRRIDSSNNIMYYYHDDDHWKDYWYWSPAKSKITNFYPGGGGGSQVEGTRMSIPGERGMALKVVWTNFDTKDYEFASHFLINIPNISKKKGWMFHSDPSDPNTAVQKVEVIDTLDYAKGVVFKASFDPVSYSWNSNPVYLVVGLISDNTETSPIVNYRVEDFTNRSRITDDFKDGNPALITSGNNTNDSYNFGSSVGFTVWSKNKLPNGGKQQFTFLAFLDENKDTAINKWKEWTVKDIESEVDTRMNQKIADMFTDKLPKVQTGNSAFDAFYRNSALSVLLNKWDIFPWVSQVIKDAKAVDFFPWTTGTETILSLSMGKDFWRQQLLRLLEMDYRYVYKQNDSVVSYLDIGCKSQQSEKIAGANIRATCDWSYSYNIPSIVRLVDRYISLYSDDAINFLNTEVVNRANDGSDGKQPNEYKIKVVDLLERMVNQIDAKAVKPSIIPGAMPGSIGDPNKPLDSDVNLGTTKFTDMGLDGNLYEHDLNNCKEQNPVTGSNNDIGYDYEGNVITPNAERYESHKAMARMMRLVGRNDRADLHDNKWAVNLKNLINTQYVPSWNWFYAKENDNSEPFYFLPIYNMIGMEGLINQQTISQMIDNHFRQKFISATGRLNITQDGNNAGQSNSNCIRYDWQGPGLYSGQIGKILSDLLQYGVTDRKSMVWDVYRGYMNKWAGMPILPQMYAAEDIIVPTGWSNSPYVEASAFAEVVIKGMMGLNPIRDILTENNITWVNPRIPNELLQSGDVVIRDAYSQSHLFSLWAKTGESGKYSIYIEVCSACNQKLEHMRFGYDGDKLGDITLTNLVPGSYSVKWNDPNKTTSDEITNTDENGVLKLQLNLPANQKTRVYLFKTSDLTNPTGSPTPIITSTPFPTLALTSTPTPTLSLTPTLTPRPSSTPSVTKGVTQTPTLIPAPTSVLELTTTPTLASCTSLGGVCRLSCSGAKISGSCSLGRICCK